MTDDSLAPATSAVPVLTALARGMYPHSMVEDAAYRRTVERVLGDAAKEPELLRTILAGAQCAQQDLGCGAELAAITTWLADRAGTPFFSVFRDRISYHLYDDPEVQEALGYPGSSYQLGGYLHRGFADLDWLPEPRVTDDVEGLAQLDSTTKAGMQR